MSITTDDPPPTTIDIFVTVRRPGCASTTGRVLAEVTDGFDIEVREVDLLTVEGTGGSLALDDVLVEGDALLFSTRVVRPPRGSDRRPRPA